MDIKVIATVKRIRFYKDQWGIVVCSIDAVEKGELLTNEEETIFRGEMPEPRVGNIYTITANYVSDPKWGDQYQIEGMFSTLSLNDKDGKKKFLLSLFTLSQVKAMYDALDDPFEVLDNGDIQSLVKVKGCGIKTADFWIRKFKNHVDAAKVFVELSDYGLTNKIINKLINRYNSPDLVIDKVKNNPYILCNEVDGIGWKKADEIALSGGVEQYGILRVSAYIERYLTLCGEEGCSWITPDQLLGAVLETIGDDVPDDVLTEAIRGFGDKIWWNETKDKIGLSRYYNIENSIAKELIRIRDAENNIKYDNWEDKISELENKQGWNFTDEQLKAVRMALDNNIITIMGCAGSGKTSTVSAILAVLCNYSYAMCALSGRAAARLAEVTNDEGYTIHRLLGYPKGEPEYQLFEYNQDNPLPYDIIIIDEISMVDARLFKYLLRAIPNGAKLICLGDQAQLEAIGCGNIAHDMIESFEIPTAMLTKIHRQAAMSGIITESTKIRNGHQIVNKNWAGREIRGDLKDIDIIGYSDANNTFYEIMKVFSELQAKPDFNIMETQIIVPIKTRGAACTYIINNTIQEMFNPCGSGKIEKTQFSNGKPYILREGDKVMNMANNYNTEIPIYNGNVGMLKKFATNENGEEIMIIDFVGIGTVDVPKDHWNNIDLGYACSVHKYQGSEADYVIFGFDFSAYALLTRELVYTGITRAKKKCYIVAQTSALRYATAQHAISQKQTHLQQCLYDVAHPKIIF